MLPCNKKEGYLCEIIGAFRLGGRLRLVASQEGSFKYSSRSAATSLCSLGLSANRREVLFSHTKSAPATSYQSAVLFSRNKSVPAVSHSQANTAKTICNHILPARIIHKTVCNHCQIKSTTGILGIYLVIQETCLGHAAPFSNRRITTLNDLGIFLAVCGEPWKCVV